MLPRARRNERWVGRVAIHRERYAELRAELLSLATHRQADYLTMRFRTVPFLPFKPVQQQLLSLLRQVNKARQHVRYELVPRECLRTFFHNVLPFQGRLSLCDRDSRRGDKHLT